MHDSTMTVLFLLCRNLIMENAVYYVASPEACAAILWKSRDKAGTVGRSTALAALAACLGALAACLEVA